MDDLEGRTAFITGGAQGIGLGMARAFARAGMNVAIADIDEPALAAARAELEATTKVTSVVLDVRDREAFAAAADEVEAELGPVTLLCNNAGVAGFATPELMTYEDWDWVLGINLGGVVNGVQTFVPRMAARGGGGHIVNTSSGAGLVSAFTGFLYATSKFAVVGMSEALHEDLARLDIGVSVLCPGQVATSIVDHTVERRPGAPVPEPLREALAAAQARLDAGTSPDLVGEMVLEAVRAGRLHVLTDDEVVDLVLERANAIAAAVPGGRAGRRATSMSIDID